MHNIKTINAIILFIHNLFILYPPFDVVPYFRIFDNFIKPLKMAYPLNGVEPFIIKVLNIILYC